MERTEAEELIRRHSTAESFRRGQEYSRAGAVTSAIRRADVLQATVEGSEPEPYQVRVTLDDLDAHPATCTCHYTGEGWCKHIVAAMLAAQDRPELVEERPSLFTMIARLDRDRLQNVILSLADANPEIVDLVDRQLATIPVHRPGAPVPEEAPPRPIPAPNPRAVRSRVRAILNRMDRLTRSEIYWETPGAMHELRQLLDRVRELINAGDGQAALDVLEAMTEAYVAGWTKLDNSSGDASRLFSELDQAWTEAILLANLTPAEREKFSTRLASWATQIARAEEGDDFRAAIAAAAVGWDEPSVQAILMGGSGSTATGRAALTLVAPPALTAARLHVLERQGRTEEYLRLARATHQTVPYAVMLLKLGRGPEALEAALRDCRTADEAGAVARAFEQHGQPEPALRIALYGLTLEGLKSDVGEWARDLAVRLGHPEQALNAARIAFDERPSLRAYTAMQAIAGEEWPKLRIALLDRLRLIARSHSDDAVDIFLHERSIDDAIAAIGGIGTDEATERVVEAAVETRPRWAIGTARQRAEAIMNASQSSRYHHAERWLLHAREAYRALGRLDEWNAYLQELLGKHRRKPRLRAILEALTE